MEVSGDKKEFGYLKHLLCSAEESNSYRFGPT